MHRRFPTCPQPRRELVRLPEQQHRHIRHQRQGWCDIVLHGFLHHLHPAGRGRTPYLSQTVSLRPTFNGRLTRWMSLSYELGYSHYILSLPGTGTSESKDNFSHTLSLNLSPHRSLDLKLSTEHYYTMLTADQAKNTVLLDASVAWRLKGGVELSLTAR